jgi:DNA polymerase III delta prime subunit
LRELVGHHKARTELSEFETLPPALLLLGPEGVGKRTLARSLARGTGAEGLDLQLIDRLTKATAREVAEHHEHFPLASPVRATVADLTAAPEDALNALLKLVEHPPPYSHLIFHSDTYPALTMRSRCHQVHFGRLTEEEVVAVLRGLHTSGDLETAARMSSGRVSVALAYLSEHQPRADAERILRAAAQRRRTDLEEAFSEILKLAGESYAEREARLDVLCRLLARSIRSSLSPTERDHALAGIPAPVRMEALLVLEGRSRSSLRLKAGAYALLGTR